MTAGMKLSRGSWEDTATSLRVCVYVCVVDCERAHYQEAHSFSCCSLRKQIRRASVALVLCVMRVVWCVWCWCCVVMCVCCSVVIACLQLCVCACVRVRVVWCVVCARVLCACVCVCVGCWLALASVLQHQSTSSGWSDLIHVIFPALFLSVDVNLTQHTLYFTQIFRKNRNRKLHI